jgi:hypothetical protein
MSYRVGSSGVVLRQPWSLEDLAPLTGTSAWHVPHRTLRG